MGERPLCTGLVQEKSYCILTLITDFPLAGAKEHYLERYGN